MRPSLWVLVVVVALLAASSCASATEDSPAPTPAREIVSGGARIRGGGVRMDVQIGRPVSQGAVRNGKVIARPAAVVTP